MRKRIKGLTAIGLLALLLTSCSSAPPVEAQAQPESPTIYLMAEEAETPVQDPIKLPISTTTSSAEEVETSSAPEPVKEAELPAEHLIEDFPIIFQMPELPTGCEITAMTMALNYYGYQVDKTTMAAEYLPTVPANRYHGEDGRLYGSDLRSYFVGDPFTQAGYICGPKAILTAANDYLQEMESSMRATDKSGASPEELYELVSQNTPVVVWVTIGMADRETPQGWYTESGDYVDWSTNDHGAVLIGYSEDTVTIADPISGMVEYSRDQFESVYTSRSCQCVILR